MRGLLISMLVLPAWGCGSEDDPAAPPLTPPPAGCAEHELALPSGACIRPGIPVDGCAEGFEHDGEYGCEPILPPEPCPPGQMAVPGDTACHRVMSCGSGKWGDIVVDATTVFVDGGYGGTDADGSMDKPWTTIGDAIAAATTGDLIAIAAGSYAEDLLIGGKMLRLRGVCPELVEISGTGAQDAALIILSNADGTEIGGLAIRGDAWGVGLSGSEDVLFDRVWVHDCGGPGINVPRDLGETSCTIRSSLIEGNHQVAVVAWGSTVSIEGSLIRDTLTDGVKPLANGLYAQDHGPTGTVAQVTVRGSVLERNRGVSLFVDGAAATIEGVVVRDTLPEDDQGRAIVVQDDEQTGARATAVVRASVLERNVEQALSTANSDVTIESVVIRDTLPNSMGRRGGGISIDESAGTAPVVVLKSSLLERNQEVAIHVEASHVDIEGTVVRDTLAGPTGAWGRGINVQGGAFDGSAPSVAVLRSLLIERSSDVGVCIIGSDVTMESTIVRSTAPRPFDGLFGDGVTVYSHGGAARLIATDVVVDQSARAGLASFGAFVSLAEAAVSCAAFELEGEHYEGAAFQFEDRGGNACGCPAQEGACAAVSVGLQPPDAEVL